MTQSISFNLIIKNEANIIEQCLNSIKPIADEIIVVDTGSTDNTIELCRKYTDKIFEFKFTNDFSVARNFAKSKSSEKWIFIIDADEIIVEEEYNKILQSVNNNNIDAYITTTKNFTNDSTVGKWKINTKPFEQKYSQNSSGWFPSDKVRLFKNKPEFYFENKVHELIKNSIEQYNGKIVDAEFFIYHYGYLLLETNPELYKNKLELYDKLGEQKFSENKSPKSAFELAKQKFRLNKFNKAIELFEYCIKNKYRLSETYSELSAVYIKLNKIDKALYAGEKSLIFNNKNIAGLNNYAVALKYKNLFKESLDVFKRIIKLDDKHINAYFNIGVIYDELNRFNEAIKYYKKCLDINQNYIPVIKNIIIDYITELKKISESEKYLKLYFELIGKEDKFYNKYNNLFKIKLEKLKVNDHKKFYNKGYEYYKNNEYKKAIIQLQKSLSINVNFATINLLLNCYKNLGNTLKYNLLKKKYNL